MKKIKQYTVVTNNSLSVLILDVNKKIAEGWQPLNGINSSYNSYNYYFEYNQTMIKYDDEYTGRGLGAG